MATTKNEVYNKKTSHLRKWVTDRHPKPAKKKKVLVPLRTKCSPSNVASTMNKIKVDQRKCKIDEDMGFKSLISIQCKTLPREYVIDLLSRFDPNTCLLRVDGSSPLLVTMRMWGGCLGSLILDLVCRCSCPKKS